MVVRSFPFAPAVALTAALAISAAAPVSAQASGVLQASVTVLAPSAGSEQVFAWAKTVAELPAGRPRMVQGGNAAPRVDVERRPEALPGQVAYAANRRVRVTVTYLH